LPLNISAPFPEPFPVSGRANGLSCGDCDRSRLGINAARFRTLRDLCSSAPHGGALTRGV